MYSECQIEPLTVKLSQITEKQENLWNFPV